MTLRSYVNSHFRAMINDRHFFNQILKHRARITIVPLKPKVGRLIEELRGLSAQYEDSITFNTTTYTWDAQGPTQLMSAYDE